MQRARDTATQATQREQNESIIETGPLRDEVTRCQEAVTEAEERHGVCAAAAADAANELRQASDADTEAARVLQSATMDAARLHGARSDKLRVFGEKMPAIVDGAASFARRPSRGADVGPLPRAQRFAKTRPFSP